MQTKLFKFVLMCIFASCAFGGAPEILWNSRFSNSGESVLWDATSSSDGGYLAVGQVSTGSSENHALSICKIDQDGLVLWENTALSLGNASAFSIKQHSDGFVICGERSGSAGKSGLILKIDSEGNTLWSMDIDYAGDDALFDLCITSEGNILAVGYSENKEASDNDILAVCVSDSGSVLWEKRYFNPNYQVAYTVVSCTGASEGCYLTGSDGGDAFLMKIDKFGNWKWKTNHFMAGSQTGRSVTLLSEGGYIVAGSTREGSGFSDALLVFFDEDGKVTGDHTWGLAGPDNAYSILEMPPAGYVVLVNSNSGSGDGYRSSLVRFDPWLSEIWSCELLDRDAICYSFEIIENEGFIVSGKMSLPEGETGYSSFFVKLSDEDLLNW